MNVCFDVRHLYYLPQFFPVYTFLHSKGDTVTFVCYNSFSAVEREVINNEAFKKKLSVFWLDDIDAAFDFYQNSDFDWIVFGNSFKGSSILSNEHKTALMQHGIGPKSCYYDVSNEGMSVRFVEGKYRLEKLQKLFPNGCFIDTGYAKLDPLFNGNEHSISLESLGLEPKKKTILYAPTFYPSSIELMPDNLPDLLSDYNLIIKPHQFSLEKNAYVKQKEKLKRMSLYGNVYVADFYEYNLIPFLGVADIMLSDASSAIFEFLALGKPVIWCDFYKLRWSYRGIFSFRLKARLSEDMQFFERLCYKATNPKNIIELLDQSLNEPSDLKKERVAALEALAGRFDGNASKRIVDYMRNSL